MEIDLDAIAANVSALRAAANAELIAVVKAEAYGHGAVPVSRTVLEAGAAMLAVGTVEEGIVLRRAGISAEILVLLGAVTPAEARDAVESRLTPTVWEVGHAVLLAETARAARRSLNVHFKVDTGLTRLGSPAAEALDRLTKIRALNGITVDGLFTHYARGDDPDPSFALAQLALFEEFVRAAGSQPRWIHAAASAGVAALGAQPMCNAIRPGLAVYGLSPAAHLTERVKLRPALSWRSAVRRVVDVPAGTGVSYGHEYRLPRPGRIATVPIGYGDGLARSARGGSLLIGGVPTPIVGRVCMDMVMLDVTDRSVSEGDEAVIIGEQSGARQTADDLARTCGTISYEVVTNIRARVGRSYLQGGREVATATLSDGFVWL